LGDLVEVTVYLLSARKMLAVIMENIDMGHNGVQHMSQTRSLISFLILDVDSVIYHLFSKSSSGNHSGRIKTRIARSRQLFLSFLVDVTAMEQCRPEGHF
jgi:hypothetical protein